jgi:sugar phosphate isomerase/epimerase
MRIGLSTYTFSWAVGVPGQRPAEPLSAVQVIDRAHALGVPVVQIVDNWPLDALSDDDLDALARHANGLGVSLEVGTRGVRPDHVRRYLEIAARLGSPILRVVVDRAAHQPAPDEIVALLAPKERLFRDAGITLAIENHERLPAATFAAIVRRLGVEWVGICLDTVNSLGALEGPDIVLDALAPLAVNLHVKDFDVVRSNRSLGFSVEGRPVGQGRLDLPRLFDAVGGPGRDITAVIELWTPWQGTLEDTIDLERRWAQQSVAHLKEVLLSGSELPLARSEG